MHFACIKDDGGYSGASRLVWACWSAPSSHCSPKRLIADSGKKVGTVRTFGGKRATITTTCHCHISTDLYRLSLLPATT